EKERLNNLVQLINGFASELSLEILATVAFILEQHPSYSFEQVMESVAKWSDRKKKLFKESYVKTAYDHLLNYRNLIIRNQI
ncbi:MAG TPA: hypothetical protein VHC96_13710, partial [Puia sp.]|nr:hypothetical protein [Puia sp.]